jgi:hypothetical protein
MRQQMTTELGTSAKLGSTQLSLNPDAGPKTRILKIVHLPYNQEANLRFGIKNQPYSGLYQLVTSQEQDYIDSFLSMIPSKNLTIAGDHCKAMEWYPGDGRRRLDEWPLCSKAPKREARCGGCSGRPSCEMLSKA